MSQPEHAATGAQPTYPWYLRGVVVHGHGRGGSKLGYPTANVRLDEPTVEALKPYNNLVLFGFGCIEPALEGSAVAAGVAQEDLGPFPFAMSVGYNPQFKDIALSAEVHFLKTFHCDFYDHTIRIVVIDSIRAMSAFTTLEELIDTINADVAKTQERLKQPEAGKYKHDPFVQPSVPLPPDVAAKPTYFCCEK